MRRRTTRTSLPLRRGPHPRRTPLLPGDGDRDEGGGVGDDEDVDNEDEDKEEYENGDRQDGEPSRLSCRPCRGALIPKGTRTARAWFTSSRSSSCSDRTG